jgi:hypothetical protein
MPHKTKPSFTLPLPDRDDTTDLVRHLLAIRADIEQVVATENPGLSAEAREHLVQAATDIVASWYNTGKE